MRTTMRTVSARNENSSSLSAAVQLLLLLSTILVLHRLPTANAMPAPYELTSQQIADFRRDGVIVVRGMLEGETLDNAVKAAHKVQRTQGWAQSLVHKMFPVYRNLSFQTYRKHEALKTVAFDSTAPTICAKLMGLDEEQHCKEGIKKKNNSSNTSQQRPRSLRLLKEAVMGFSRGDQGCGWHVDDKTFWPCEDSHQDNSEKGCKSNRSSSREAGINVWISLSPVTAAEGGGLAVAPGSHNLTGKGRAGSIFRKARMAIASMGAQTTCALAQVDPSSHEYMERTKRVYDLQPGDAIIHDRYTFHKPDSFNENFETEEKTNATKQRISLRYMPSDATFFDNGQGLDGASIHKNLQTGDPLWKAGEYFPQAWPSSLQAESKASPKQDVNAFGTRFLLKIGRYLLTPQKPNKD